MRRLPLYIGIFVFVISLVTAVATISTRQAIIKTDINAGQISPTPTLVPTIPRQ
ncbi:hypothetical protein HYW54_04975 [Candidatus Gottesmanbacteria bacterium]|nr:hypothetical protein [Candidatus Gottesmanbacteria bacterium]